MSNGDTVQNLHRNLMNNIWHAIRLSC